MSHSRLRLSRGLVTAPWVSTTLSKQHMRFGARTQFEIAVILWLCLQETAWVQMSLDLKPHLYSWHEQEEYLYLFIYERSWTYWFFQ